MRTKTRFSGSRAPRRAMLLTAMLAAFAAQQSAATLISMEDFFIRDYLDFAQNKGVFQPGAENITITKKDGTTWSIPNLPFIDFSAGSNDGTSTAIGGAFVVTAAHYFSGTGTNARPHNVVKTPVYGQTKYNYVEVKKNGDFAVERLDKFIVETGGTAATDISSLTYEELQDRFGVEIDGEKRVLGFHAGTGEIQLKFSNDSENFYDYRAPLVGNDPVFKNGAIFEISPDTDPNRPISAEPLKWLMEYDTFVNRTTNGDSGSGFYLYDSQQGEWLLVGTLYGTEVDRPTYTIVNPWSDSTVNALQAAYRQDVAIDGGELTFDGGLLTLDGTDIETVTSAKDLYFTGGGSIVLASDMTATEGGYGLVFDGSQTYSVSGTGSYKGAGLDVGEGTTVEWNVAGTTDDSLHKIGSGTLSVNVAQGNTLRLGEGTVVLKAENAFENIYVSSGRGTVKVDAENALAAGANGGVYFSTKGGTLDLNGHDWTLEKIAATDTGAVITNSSETASEVKLTASDNYGFHGRLEGNVNLTHTQETLADSQYLVLDGGFDITGTVSAEKSNLVLQGKPVAHATITTDGAAGGASYGTVIIEHETEAAESLGLPWMISNEVSTFDQPDWENRVFTADEIRLTDSTLTVGRNAEVNADISAVRSVVTLGGEKAWRDRWDGLNITGDGFEFRQEMVEGTSEANDTISYSGTITATDSDIYSHLTEVKANLNLTSSSFTDESGSGVLNVQPDGITLTNGSVLTVPTILVQDLLNVHITADQSSVMNIDTLHADNSVIYVDDQGRSHDYVLKATNRSFVHVSDWTFAPGNLIGDEDSRFIFGKLTANAGNRIDAMVEIEDRLDIRNMSARLNNPLSVRDLTLGYYAKVGVAFDDETVSSQNYAFDTPYTVLTADTLTDQRGDKNLEVTLPGTGVGASSAVDGNRFTVTFEDLTPPDPGPEPEPEPEPTPDPEPSEPIGEAVRAQLTVRESALLAMIEEHNENASPKWQQVAVHSALTNPDPAAGAAALRNEALRRTDATMDRIAQTVDAKPLFDMMDRTVSNRIATRGMKWREYRSADTSVFADMTANYLHEDSGRSTKVWGITAGFDKELDVAAGKVVAGAVFGAAKLDRDASGWTDEGTMLTAAAYADWRPNALTEVVGSVSMGYADSDKKVTADANVEAQSMSDDTLAFQLSGSFKHQVWQNDAESVMVKPLFKADFGWFRTSSAESEFFTRERTDGYRFDMSLGIEAEVRDFRSAQVFRAAVRKNIADTADTADVKLSGASSAMTYGIREHQDAAALDLAWYANWKLDRRWTVTSTLSGTVDADSAWGASGNLGIQYRW